MTDERVLLLGWDGATWDAIDPLLAAGQMPVLADLLTRGFRGVLRSTVPPVTPAAWTSIATGQGPGRTGVLGFRHLDLRRPSGFDPRLAGSRDLRGRTLFEHAGAAGLGVSLAAYPMTWPPFDLPGGVMLAGWPRPETARAPIAPLEEAARFPDWGDGEDRPSSTRMRRDGVEDPEGAARELDERTMAVARSWLERRRDRLVVVGLQGTDHLAHRFWGQPELERCYQRFDGWLGELIQAMGPGAATLLVSDHGFGPGPSARVHLGRALADGGLLTRRAATAPIGGRASRALRDVLPPETWKRVRGRLPDGLRRWGFERAQEADGFDPSGTQVTRVPLYEGWDGLVVQVRGRQRGGTVPPERWEAVRRQAAETIDRIAYRGHSVVRRIWTREEVWVGPALPGMPDLVVELRDGFTAGDRMDPGPVSEPLERAPGAGSHRRQGIVAGAGPGLQCVGDVGLVDPWDVLPTALALLDLGVPRGIDGAPLQRLLTRTAPAPVARLGGAPPAADAESESDGLERSLRELGYLS